MKKYRLTKRYIGLQGEIYEPQEVICDEQYRIYKIRENGNNSNLFQEEIDPEQMIRAGADFIEEVKPERWRASLGEIYWYVNFPQMTMDYNHYDTRDLFSHQCFEVGNYFQTKEQAQRALGRIKQVLLEEQDKILEEGI